jgi:purine-nucleoside phosphorylase
MTSPLPTADLARRVDDAVRAIRARTSLEPRVALTLGSGLGSTIDALEDAVIIQTADLPHWPRSTVPGHAGRIALARWRDVPVVALSGRSHRYEGYTLDRVTFGVRVMAALGARTMVFTNAVGAINPDYRPGELMLASDHFNFIGKRGLFTPDELVERRAGRRVVRCYSSALRERLIEAALAAGIPLRSGILMGGHGPSYETAAEVRMAWKMGADVACMSTVHEVLLAAELGCECASLSCITNRATGLSETRLTHEEVTEVADRVAERLRAILDQFLTRFTSGAVQPAIDARVSVGGARPSSSSRPSARDQD